MDFKVKLLLNERISDRNQKQQGRMKISKTEIRLRRLLAAVPQQTNKYKLVHHVATLKKLLNSLKNETAESSYCHSSTDVTREYYSRCIEELTYNLDDTGMDDIWDSFSVDQGPEVSGRAASYDVGQLSPGPSASDSPLFPSCLKRKYSPDAGLLYEVDWEESGVGNLKNMEDDNVGKRLCVDLNEHEAGTSKEIRHLDPGTELVGKSEEDYSRENVAHTANEHERLELELEYARKLRQTDGTYVAQTSPDGVLLEHEIESGGRVSSEDAREDEVEHLDHEARLHIRQQRNDQEKMVNEMLVLTNQIKEGSLLLGNSLHRTEELLSSSELTIKHCLSATTSAQLKTGELLTQTQERECRCATWFSLLLMYIAFLYMVLYIRVT